MITGLKAFVTAFCRMILTGDRINTLFDLSFKRWNWAGNDRPFKHTTLNGTHQVCVEITRTNVFLNSGNPVQQNIAVDNEPCTISFEGDGSIELTNAHTATIQGTAGVRTELTFTPSAGTLNVDPTNVEKVQIEKGLFSTTYIETGAAAVTRLSPNPILNDTLPVEGVIAGWLEFTKVVGQPIFRAGFSVNTNRTDLFLLDGISFRCRLFGSTGGFITLNHGWAWDANSRKKFGFLVTFKSDTATLYLIDEAGVMVKATSVITNNGIDKNIHIGELTGGNQGSIRFETGLYIKPQSNIVTDAEAKEILSKLSKYKGGANLEPENIVIQ